MNPVEQIVRGGQFLTSQIDQSAIFTPEDQTDEHRMMAKTARRFLEEAVYPERERLESGDYDLVESLMKQAGELGLLAHSIPESYGGLGLDKMSKGIVGEALGAGGGYSVAHNNHTCIASLPITYFGTKEQKAKYLPKLASGEYIGAYCLTEPDAGSDALAAKTTAVLDETGHHYVLNGTKIYITNASFSDTFIVYAKVDGEHFTAFIVEKGFEGLSVGPEEDKMGIKASSTCSVIMEDCKVPKENVLGEVGKGHHIALNVLNLGRFNLGAATTGAAKFSFGLGLSHIQERKQFGRSIAQFNGTKQKVAKMAAKLYASESVMYRTAGHVESVLRDVTDETSGRDVAKKMNEHSFESAMCKVFGSETLDEVVDEALQLHGGAGYIKEYPIEQAYRDARINRIFEGTNEINRLHIAGVILKKSASGELPLQKAVEEAHTHMHRPNEAPSLEQGVQLLKDLFFVCAGAAYSAFGQELQEEQETMMGLADLAIMAYAAESAVVRARKSGKTLHQDLATSYIERAGLEAGSVALMLASNLTTGDVRTETLASISSVQALLQYEQSVSRNRRIADAMLTSNTYLV
ncbi:acyl-CoA dehydrogenase [Pontibacillus halophilus JSM 076056 = DSM 19796]|uniref:Acyl-CoA dehydrogenase n=1 Tax=Pontibacillus halophilus JSM 076056 = DSM 19796 TaxID=1385510 RepID=A0A0A5GDJ9_9BACI|nr:acyl-CoA dehydrogenase family protein [Pontibacillus halophilus]KGX91296.1 acyl-CoA dehydrogenase [Pontibacillus halophilus JSM 076056 = DSM 19796]